MTPSTKTKTQLLLALLIVAVALAASVFFLMKRPKVEEAPPKAQPGNLRGATAPYKNRALWRSSEGAKALPATPSISGAVYDIDGRALRGATVVASTFEVSGNRLSTAGSAKSDERGQFKIELPDGMYHVSARLEGYAPASATLVSGETISLVLQRMGTIVGHVYDESGAPVPHFSLDLISIVSSDLAAPPPLQTRAVHNDDGSFRVDEVPSWGVVVRATATGYAPGFSPRVKVPSGETRSVDIRLSKGCTLVGRAENERGEPVAGVLVNAESRFTAGALGETSVEAADDVYSDDSGAFRLENVPMGPVSIRGYDDKYAVTTANLSIDSCDPPPVVRLVMSKGGSLKGVARRADGSPLPNARLSLTKRSIGFVNAMTDAEGRFRFDEIPAGKARMELLHEGQRILVIVDVKAGEVTQHDVTLAPVGDGELRGRVMAGQSPLPGARLMVASNNGDAGIAIYYPVADSEGYYSVKPLPAGAYMVNVLSTTQGGAVQILPNEAATLDVSVTPPPPRPRKERAQQQQQDQ